MKNSDNKPENNKETEEHVYDGILEHDNPLPRWWVIGFYLTIVFAAFYYTYYQLGSGPSLNQELQQDRQAIEVADLTKNGQRKLPTQQELLALFNNPASRKQGKEVFTSRCVSCHGDHGQGGIGPNLTDAYWIHGGKLEQIAATITNGVSDKGMPPWGPMLAADEIKSLAVYIKSLKESNPAGAKAPQGEQEKD